MHSYCYAMYSYRYVVYSFFSLRNLMVLYVLFRVLCFTALFCVLLCVNVYCQPNCIYQIFHSNVTRVLLPNILKHMYTYLHTYIVIITRPKPSDF